MAHSARARFAGGLTQGRRTRERDSALVQLPSTSRSPWIGTPAEPSLADSAYNQNRHDIDLAVKNQAIAG